MLSYNTNHHIIFTIYSLVLIPNPSFISSKTTPISAPSHSLIMVIAGVFLGIIMDDMIIIIIDYFSLVCLFFYLIPLNTLL